MRRCPSCRTPFESTASRCPDCGVDLVEVAPEPTADPEDVDVELVTVQTALSPMDLQHPLVVLKDNGIAACIHEDALNVIYGGAPFRSAQLKVLASEEETAKQILCQNDIQCEIPADMVDRFLHRLIEPLLAGDERSVPSLLETLGKQTSDFRELVFRKTLERPRGSDLVLKLLLAAHLAPEVPIEHVRRDLALALRASEADDETATETIVAALADHGDAGVRRRLATTLLRLRTRPAVRQLIALLDDPSSNVRDEALESLYVLSDGQTFDFAPNGPPGERDAAIQRWRQWEASQV